MFAFFQNKEGEGDTDGVVNFSVEFQEDEKPKKGNIDGNDEPLPANKLTNEPNNQEIQEEPHLIAYSKALKYTCIDSESISATRRQVAAKFDPQTLQIDEVPEVLWDRDKMLAIVQECLICEQQQQSTGDDINASLSSRIVGYVGTRVMDMLQWPAETQADTSDAPQSPDDRLVSMDLLLHTLKTMQAYMRTEKAHRVMKLHGEGRHTFRGFLAQHKHCPQLDFASKLAQYELDFLTECVLHSQTLEPQVFLHKRRDENGQDLILIGRRSDWDVPIALFKIQIAKEQIEGTIRSRQDKARLYRLRAAACTAQNDTKRALFFLKLQKLVKQQVDKDLGVLHNLETSHLALESADDQKVALEALHATSQTLSTLRVEASKLTRTLDELQDHIEDQQEMDQAFKDFNALTVNAGGMNDEELLQELMETDNVTRSSDMPDLSNDEMEKVSVERLGTRSVDNPGASVPPTVVAEAVT